MLKDAQTSRSLARAKALAQDDNVWWLELENSCQRAAEPGQHVLAQQRAVIRDDVFRCSVNTTNERSPAGSETLREAQGRTPKAA